MPHEIILSQGPDSWLATFTDPAIKEALGTDTLPCPFTNRAPAERVLSEIQKLNPTTTVSLAMAGGAQ
jgi:hypothetical protein